MAQINCLTNEPIDHSYAIVFYIQLANIKIEAQWRKWHIINHSVLSRDDIFLSSATSFWQVLEEDNESMSLLMSLSVTKTMEFWSSQSVINVRKISQCHLWFTLLIFMSVSSCLGNEIEVLRESNGQFTGNMYSLWREMQAKWW